MLMSRGRGKKRKRRGDRASTVLGACRSLICQSDRPRTTYPPNNCLGAVSVNRSQFAA